MRHGLVRAPMGPAVKTFLVITVTVVITYVLSLFLFKWQVRNEIIPAFIREANEMESFNTMRRLESYDDLATLLKRGCVKEARQWVELYQRLSLKSLAHEMTESASIERMLQRENSEIADRARFEGKSMTPLPSVPICK